MPFTAHASWLGATARPASSPHACHAQHALRAMLPPRPWQHWEQPHQQQQATVTAAPAAAAAAVAVQASGSGGPRLPTFFVTMPSLSTYPSRCSTLRRCLRSSCSGAWPGYTCRATWTGHTIFSPSQPAPLQFLLSPLRCSPRALSSKWRPLFAPPPLCRKGSTRGPSGSGALGLGPQHKRGQRGTAHLQNKALRRLDLLLGQLGCRAQRLQWGPDGSERRQWKGLPAGRWGSQCSSARSACAHGATDKAGCGAGGGRGRGRGGGGPGPGLPAGPPAAWHSTAQHGTAR